MRDSHALARDFWTGLRYFLGGVRDYLVVMRDFPGGTLDSSAVLRDLRVAFAIISIFFDLMIDSF